MTWEAVTLSVEGGEVFGFLGPNGAGKTTMAWLGALLFDRRDVLGSPMGRGWLRQADLQSDDPSLGVLEPSRAQLLEDLDHGAVVAVSWASVRWRTGEKNRR